MNERGPSKIGRWLVFSSAFAFAFNIQAQTASNACSALTTAQYPVDASCVNRAFNKPGSFTSSMSVGTCNGGAYDDAWGWFRATSAFTTVQFTGDQDAILHVFTGSCTNLEYVACSDIFGANIAESVTIPTVINQDYFIRVQRYGSNVAMNGNLCVFSTNPTTNCGTTVYDSGGSTGNYGNNERWFRTYCPNTPGEAVTLNFTSFNLENGWDYLTVFSGSGTGGILLGQFTGTTLPPSLTSADPSGCITIVFFSDGSGVRAGWAANVVCAPPPDCFYVLTLNDSFGDGWGASSVGYSINGGPYQYWTIGGSSGQVLIPLSAGDIFVLDYNASGLYQIENSFSLSIAGEGSLYASGSPPGAGLHFPHVVDCIPLPAPPEDCLGSTTICSNQAFNGNTTSTGFVQDLGLGNRGCLGSSERQGTWYSFSPTNTGTVAFTISPSNPTDDYDFAIWGPFPPGSSIDNICPPPGPPLRCSYAAPSGDTGLNFTALDLSEDPWGDKWVRFISALPDQVFLLYISNWSRSGLAFSLDWNPAMTAELDCTILPIDLASLRATPQDRSIDVDWVTMSQRELSHFIVQRSADGRSFSPLGTMDAGGDSFVRKDYRFVDNSPLQGINFYRLVTVGADGKEEFSDVVTARMGTVEPVLVPNPTSGPAVLYTGNIAPAGSLLRITDASGRLIQESSIITDAVQHDVDLLSLSSGVYMLSLHMADGTPIGHSRFVKE